MRIVMVEPAGNLWGSERVFLDMLQYWNPASAVVCCPPGTPLVKELAALNIAVEGTFIADLHKRGKADRLRAAFGVFRTCLKHRPDLVYINQAGCLRVVRAATRLLRLPVVTHVRLFDDVPYLASVAPNVRDVSSVVAVSEAVADEIRAVEALRDINVDTLYDAFAEPPALPVTLQRDANLLGCVGRIVPIKGQSMLLEALALGRPKIPSLRTVFVGSGGKYEEELKGRSASLGLEKAVEWLGFHSRPIEIMARCNAIVVPSAREPLGRVIFEAWHAGCVPIACARAGGAAEVIRKSGGGILYDDNTPQSLWAAIEQTLGLSAAERFQMVSAGGRWMRQHCRPEAYATAMAAIFQRAVKSRRA